MLNEQERLEFCAKCTNRNFDPKQGIVCGLTGTKPTFEMSCPDYVIDPKALVKHGPMEYIEPPVSEKDKKKAGRHILLGVLLIIFGLVIIFLNSLLGSGTRIFGISLVGILSLASGIIALTKGVRDLR